MQQTVCLPCVAPSVIFLKKLKDADSCFQEEGKALPFSDLWLSKMADGGDDGVGAAAVATSESAGSATAAGVKMHGLNVERVAPKTKVNE